MEQGDWQGYINRYSGSAPPAPQAAAPPRISLFVQLTDTTSSERTQQVAQDPALYDSNGSPSPKRSKPAEPLASQESPLQAHGGQAPALPDDGGGACAAAVALQRLEGAAAAARAPESNRPPDKVRLLTRPLLVLSSSFVDLSSLSETITFYGVTHSRFIYRSFPENPISLSSSTRLSLASSI